jgi:septal ring factor EnvC (AmiA/AmiB activator)
MSHYIQAQIMKLISQLLLKIKIYLIMTVILAAAAYAAHYYYTDTQAKLAQYAANQARLETALETQKAATDALKQNIQVMQTTVRTLNQQFTDSRRTVQELERRFNETSAGQQRDFGALAAAKPVLVQTIVNIATQDVFKCFEQISGANVETDSDLYKNCNSIINSTDINGVQ